MQYHMNVKHYLLCQINTHHHYLVYSKSNVFLRCKKSHPFLFDTTGKDKVARVCTTNITKTVNIVPSKESYFLTKCQGLAYLHIAEFTSWICLDSKCEVINVVCFWGFVSSFNLSSGYSLQLQVNLKMLHVWRLPSLRKQLIFHHASSCVATQIWTVLLTRWSKFPTDQKLYADLGCARQQYGIFTLVSQMSFRGETTGGIVKSWLFSQAITPFLPLKLSNLFSQLVIQQAAKLINMVQANVEQS